jgi:hypothetical protein
MVLETLVLSTFNHLTQLEARENFINTMCHICLFITVVYLTTLSHMNRFVYCKMRI